MMDKTKMPKLFQYAVCPFCQKVDAVLSYKKIPYEAVEVHPLNKKEIQFSKSYQKVPIYVEKDGRQINDSTEIMKHIDSTYSNRPIFEKDPVAMAKEEQWIKWADEVLVKALPPLVYRNLKDSCNAFDYITKVGKFSFIQRIMIKYSGALAMMMVAKKSAKRQNIPDPAIHFKNCLNDWAKGLDGGQYLNNSHPNGADLAVYGILKSIGNLPSFKFVKDNRIIYDWYQRVENDVNSN